MQRGQLGMGVIAKYGSSGTPRRRNLFLWGSDQQGMGGRSTTYRAGFLWDEYVWAEPKGAWIRIRDISCLAGGLALIDSVFGQPFSQSLAVQACPLHLER